MSSKNNMELWDKLKETDPRFTKSFNRGTYSGTDISPQHRWQLLTAALGAAGSGWGVEDYQIEYFNLPEDERMVFVTVRCWYIKDGERHQTPPGFGQEYIVRHTRNGLRADDEAVKKAMTDAMGNAFKYLGLGADVYLGLYDDSKYVNTLRDKYKATAEPAGESEVIDNAPNRAIALEMMDLSEDPGEAVFIVTPNGSVQFVEQSTDKGWMDVTILMEKYMIALPSVDELVAFASLNKACHEWLVSSYDNDPIERGAQAWATHRINKIEDLTSDVLTKMWGKISRKVNALKNTQPSLYTGITAAFKGAKAKIADKKEVDDGKG